MHSDSDDVPRLGLLDQQLFSDGRRFKLPSSVRGYLHLAAFNRAALSISQLGLTISSTIVSNISIIDRRHPCHQSTTSSSCQRACRSAILIDRRRINNICQPTYSLSDRVGGAAIDRSAIGSDPRPLHCCAKSVIVIIFYLCSAWVVNVIDDRHVGLINCNYPGVKQEIYTQRVMLVISINSNNNIRQYNTMYTNLHVIAAIESISVF